MKSETFEEAKEEIIKEKKQDKIEHLKYLEKQHKEIETFMKEHNITIDEMIKGCELLKDLDYEQHEKYEKEFNNSKEARWYNL